VDGNTRAVRLAIAYLRYNPGQLEVVGNPLAVNVSFSGSVKLPWAQGVVGSNPIAPTNNSRAFLSGTCGHTHPPLLNRKLR
jgi:hypothetical protein